MDNMVHCVKYGMWMVGRCDGVKRVTPKCLMNLTFRKYWRCGGAENYMMKWKLRELTYLGEKVHK